MRIELICVGDELLRGDIADRHLAYIGRRLASIGLRPERATTVGDDAGAIAAAVAEAWERGGWILVTGGLGPTSDDLTREAVATLFDRPLEMDSDVLAGIRERFRSWGRRTVGSAERQALVPRGFRVLPNPVGTAPGLAWSSEDRRLILLPGPPREMQAVFDGSVFPEIAGERRERIGATETILVSGIGESEVQERIGGILAESGSVRASFRAEPSEVRIRLESTDPGELRRIVDVVERCLGRAVVRRGPGDLASAVGDLLARRGATVATAESCTGGLLGGRITAVPGSSAWYLGGVVAYANRIKESILGVPAHVLETEGAVSAATAAAMASGVRDRFGADYALSVTGIAGPGGGTPEKPVGLVYLGIASPEGLRTVRCRFGADRETNRRAAAARALNELRLSILFPETASGKEENGDG